MNKKEQPSPTKDIALSELDKALIMQQCENQKATSPEQIEGFTQAYKDAREFFASKGAVSKATSETLEEIVLGWAKLIEPKENARGYRVKPVVFENGNSATAHQHLPEQMKKFYEKLLAPTLKDPENAILNPDEVYKVFEMHHPFGDGNGRAGHLIWAGLEQQIEGEWPEELPPDVFNEEDLYV